MVEDEEDESLEEAETELNSGSKRKRLLILLLPILIVIGISATIFFIIQHKSGSDAEKYNIVQYNKDNAESITVFYDLPEITTNVRGRSEPHELRLKINLELSSVEDLKIIEVLSPKLMDTIITYTVELSTDEVSGSMGLYWLKEELLYRLNLAAAPIKIKALNFSVFDLQK